MKSITYLLKINNQVLYSYFIYFFQLGEFFLEDNNFMKTLI